MSATIAIFLEYKIPFTKPETKLADAKNLAAAIELKTALGVIQKVEALSGSVTVTAVLAQPELGLVHEVVKAWVEPRRQTMTVRVEGEGVVVQYPLA
jgi:hypothetical protein